MDTDVGEESEFFAGLRIQSARMKQKMKIFVYMNLKSNAVFVSHVLVPSLNSP